MKYPQIVAKARFEAAESGMPQVVFECRRQGNIRRTMKRVRYGYSTKEEYERTLALGKFPMIRLLLCMPDGTVVQ